ncbi:MAG TPA: CocE/NonD family hydrolase [Parvularculaceae bacterium]|nr:CocE/NonD family hydrolase [Parvularculaceae bacterium]
MKARLLTATIIAAALSSACLGGCTGERATPAATAGAEKPAGWSYQSYYLEMRDGVRLALSLYWPGASGPPAAPAPVVLIQTRYGRAKEAMRGGEGDLDIDYWRKRGYVVAIVDTRGSTSSFGPRDVEMGPDERADMDEIIAHLASQSWSNGKVVAYGLSYMADTADFATSRPAPALVASIPRELDFDAYAHAFMPGGVLNEFLLYEWGRYTREIDLGRSPSDASIDCRARAEDCSAMYPLLQPVDEDADYALLREALGGRERWSPEDYLEADFRDDAGKNGYSLFSFSPAAELAGIRREAKPIQIWASWMDSAVAEATLARFRSAPLVPMDIWITGNNHGQNVGADPFFPERKAPLPDRAEQFRTMIDFSDGVIVGEKTGRKIHYYVLGAETFEETSVWPPAGAEPQRFYLADGGALSSAPPSQASVIYDVDYSAGTGGNTRWSTQFGAPPAYPDRREADSKLAIFDSPPVDDDAEIVGAPVVTLYASAQSNDPAFFVYLEDVAPDGRITYLTEGELRAIHRAPADPAAMPYDQGDAPHSFARADALPVTPGEIMQLEFALNPVAVLIKKGHRLRVAIAGADADVFRRYPESGPEQFAIAVGGAKPSHIEIPMRPWPKEER